MLKTAQQIKYKVSQFEKLICLYSLAIDSKLNGFQSITSSRSQCELTFHPKNSAEVGRAKRPGTWITLKDPVSVGSNVTIEKPAVKLWDVNFYISASSPDWSYAHTPLFVYFMSNVPSSLVCLYLLRVLQ